jgi:hypothetical protein
MPPRIVVGFIIAFWLGAVGYLAYREWLPWLRADSAPPFTVELADEAAPQHARWSIWRGDQKIGNLTTRMTYLKDDSFELFSAIDNLEIRQFGVETKVSKLVTSQHVTREGQLRGLSSRLQLWIAAFGQKFEIVAIVDGEVRDGKLYARCALESPLGGASRVLEPIALESGSMLNPLQPVARVKVRPGQRWKITNVDPLATAIEASFGQLRMGRAVSPPKTLLAEVSEARILEHAGKKISCYVIEYRSDDAAGSSWVQVDDGKVLRQEVNWSGERMTLLRED